MDTLRLIYKGDKDMAMRKSFLNLGLGVVGGCLAFVAIDAMRGESAAPVSQLEIASPAAVRRFHAQLTRLILLGGRVAWI